MINAWVGHLGSYNAGYLVGEWAGLPIKEEDEKTHFFNQLRKYAAEVGEHGDEFEIFDTDTDIEGITAELAAMNFDQINELAERMDDLTSYEIELFEIIHDASGDMHDSLQRLENSEYVVLYEVDSLEDLGRAYIDEGLSGLSIPRSLEDYFDYEAYGRDLSFSGWTLNEKHSAAICLD